MTGVKFTDTIRAMTFADRWQRTQKLDGPTLVARVAEASGVPLEFVAPAAGGEVGAAYVRWPDGTPGVLTWQPGAPKERYEQIADMLALARAAGLPVPAYRLIVPLPGAVAVVQERLPGVVPTEPPVDAMIEANRRFAGLLAGRDLPRTRLWLTEDGPGFCMHGPLAEYSDRTRRVLGWVEEVGRSVPDEMPGDDLVHLDFHPGNVLVEDGRLTGIFDWDGAGPGDRRFDLVTLRYGLWPDRTDLIERVDAELDAVFTPDELRPYWATMALRQVDWAIRHYGPETIDRNATLAETRMG